MERRLRLGAILISILAAVVAFQNCAPNLQVQSNPLFSASGNGGGYFGKTYVSVSGSPCSDGSFINGQIDEPTLNVFYLTRNNCAAVSPRHLVPSDQIVKLDYTSAIVFQGIMYQDSSAIFVPTPTPPPDNVPAPTPPPTFDQIGEATPLPTPTQGTVLPDRAPLSVACFSDRLPNVTQADIYVYLDGQAGVVLSGLSAFGALPPNDPSVPHPPASGAAGVLGPFTFPPNWDPAIQFLTQPIGDGRGNTILLNPIGSTVSGWTITGSGTSIAVSGKCARQF